MTPVQYPIVIQFGNSQIRLEKQLAMWVECYDSPDLSKEISSTFQTLRSTTLGTELPVIFDFRSLHTNPVTRSFLVNQNQLKDRKVAVLVNSPMYRLVGNVFKTISNPSQMLRYFTSEEKARKWSGI